MNDTSRDSSSGGLVTEQVKQQAQQAAQSAVDQTQQVAGQAVDKATSMLDDRKDQGADTLQQTAHALRQTSQTLRDNNGGLAASLIEGSAGQIERAADYLRQHNVTDLIDGVEQYARQNGTIFMGGAFVLGLVAARFLKSSSPPPPSYSGRQGGQGGYQTYGGPYHGSQYYGGQSYGGQSYGGRYGGGQYDYSGGQYGGGEYSYTPERFDDVSGTPPVVRDYSPGLTGTESSSNGPAVDRDVM